jgi:hypothetical protein
MAEHRRGRLDAMEVRLPNLPDHLSPGLRKVAMFVALVFGVRVAASEMRCAPLAGEWVGRQPEVDMAQPVVSSHLRTLCRLGVITHVGNVPARGDRRKGSETTRLYALGVATKGEPLARPCGASYIEGFIRSAEPHESAAPQADPLGEGKDFGSVVEAEVRLDGMPGRLFAPGDSTEGKRVHAPHDTPFDG